MSEGSTPENWKRCSLDDLAEYINGLAFKPEDFSSYGLKIVRIEQLNNPDGEYDYYDGSVPGVVTVNDGDLIFSWSATLKAVIWRHGPAVLNQHLFRVIPRADVSKRFLFHTLNYHIQFLTGGAHGSTMQHITRKELKRYKVAVPRYGIQRRIAEILSTVDEAIQQTEALIAKLEKVKQGMMHDLFTRGVTPDGRLRPPREEAPELYKESPLGWIPREWEVAQLSRLVPRAVYGISESLDEESGIPVLRMNNLCKGEMDLQELKYSPSVAAKSLLLHPGDVLFNRTNSFEHVGRTAIWRGQIETASFASYLVRLETDPQYANNDFLSSWLNWEMTQKRIRQFATPGVHQVNINPTNLRRVSIAYPKSVAEQARVSEVLLSHRYSVESADSSLNELQQLKQGLMQDLLTGRVRVEVPNDSRETSANE